MAKKKEEPKRDLEYEIYHTKDIISTGIRINIKLTDDAGASIKHVLSITKLKSFKEFKGYTLVEEELFMLDKNNIYVGMSYKHWELKGLDEVGRSLATFRNLLYDNNYKNIGDKFFKGGKYKDLLEE